MAGTAPAGSRRPSARELAAATPTTRNRYVDLLRIVSIVVVVLGHWTMAVLGYRDGAFTGENLLEIAPWTHISTWVFQVMPVFFIVGGFTNVGSWRSARGRGTSYADWLRTRSARLLGPALVFVGFWTVLPMLAVAIALPSGVARTGGREVALPIWFLAVYLLAVAALPPLEGAHRRFGLRLIAVLVAGAVAVDVARYGFDLVRLGALNYAFVWLAVVELGLLWKDGALARHRVTPWAMAGGGLAALALLTTVFDYPVSMIGLTHAERSNTLPPTVGLLALAVWQCGAVLILRDVANRWLERSRVWLWVVAGNAMVMTLYLWNMTAAVLAAVILYPTGIAPQPDALSAAWWWFRPLWLLACAICLVPFVLGFRWAERPARLPPPAPAGTLGLVLAIAGALLAAAGMAIIAAIAFPVQGEQLADPFAGVACLVAGAILLRIDPFRPLRRTAQAEA
jgi:hypothetical protein